MALCPCKNLLEEEEAVVIETGEYQKAPDAVIAAKEILPLPNETIPPLEEEALVGANPPAIAEEDELPLTMDPPIFHIALDNIHLPHEEPGELPNPPVDEDTPPTPNETVLRIPNEAIVCPIQHLDEDTWNPKDPTVNAVCPSQVAIMVTATIHQGKPCKMYPCPSMTFPLADNRLLPILPIR